MVSDYNNPTDYSKYVVPGYPVRHKKKVPFEPTLKLDRTYRAVMKEIRGIDSKSDDVVLSDIDYLELVCDAYSSNVRWSIKLEGNDLPQAEVRRITSMFTEGKKDT
ncbi:MAG: hypothetical protein LBS92_07925 [Candidatus Methanoplasma sp.]|nr:hypothetical protein [Candidatus Methanoplasma sp.]